MRWVEKYKKDGKITGYERKPKAYKVHKEHVEFLLQEIKKNKTITIEDLLHLLKNKFPNLDLNKSHISRIQPPLCGYWQFVYRPRHHICIAD